MKLLFYHCVQPLLYSIRAMHISRTNPVYWSGVPLKRILLFIQFSLMILRFTLIYSAIVLMFPGGQVRQTYNSMMKVPSFYSLSNRD